MVLACHYMRLAASILSGRRRLGVELDSISSGPLPAAVVENMPRYATEVVDDSIFKSLCDTIPLQVVCVVVHVVSNMFYLS